MRVSLDEAWEKLRWANHHFEVLRSQIEPFEHRDTHSIRVEVDPQQGKYSFYVAGLEPVDPDWALMIGDCLHNARTALDYVVIRLWALVTGREPRDIDERSIAFPLYEAPKSFAGAVAEFRKEPGFSGYLATIEQLQPFNQFNPSVWGYGIDPRTGQFRTPASLPNALGRLSLLDNIDKHRAVHATWLGVRFGWWGDITTDAPDDFKAVGGSITGEPLEDGAKIGEWLFEPPLPRDWKPTEVQMKGYFPLHVAFPEPSPVKGVLEILAWCLSGVDATLRVFEPVFKDGLPPLPVTAVQTIRG